MVEDEFYLPIGASMFGTTAKRSEGFIEKIKRLLANNQSTDILLYGLRGDGKSSAGIGLGYLIDPNFTVNNIVFSMDEFLIRIEELEPGSAIVFDETGTESSGMSSRSFMSAGNKGVSDIWQMVRTKNICIICITLDAGRIDNRVRDTFRFHMSPILKLSNEDTKNHGLAIVCEIREITKVKTGEESHTLFDLKSTRPDGVGQISIPLAPTRLIYEYEIKRAGELDDLLKKTREEKAKKAEQEQNGKRGPGRPRKNTKPQGKA